MLPKVLLDAGYDFRHKTIDEAIDAALQAAAPAGG